MEFIWMMKKKLNEEEFSIALLNFFKEQFQYGGHNKNVVAEFKLLFSENIKKTLPCLTEQQVNQIVQNCLARGSIDTKDILFLDGAALQ